MPAPYAFVQTFLRRYLQSDLLYRYLRRILITAQYVLRRADEPELKAFGILGQDGDRGLLIDIGANGGQTAIAFGFICRGFEIVSFEPNPGLWSELDFARKLLGTRFSYKRCGVGDQNGSFDLHVPYVGNLPVTTQASVVADKVERAAASLKTTLGQDVEVRQVKVESESRQTGLSAQRSPAERLCPNESRAAAR